MPLHIKFVKKEEERQKKNIHDFEGTRRVSNIFRYSNAKEAASVLLGLRLTLDPSKCEDEGIWEIRCATFVLVLRRISGNNAQMSRVEKDRLFGRKETLGDDEYNGVLGKYRILIRTIDAKLRGNAGIGGAGDRRIIICVPNIRFRVGRAALFLGRRTSLTVTYAKEADGVKGRHYETEKRRKMRKLERNRNKLSRIYEEEEKNGRRLYIKGVPNAYVKRGMKEGSMEVQIAIRI